MRRSHEIVPSLGLRNMYPVDDRVDLVALELGVDTVCEECVACFVLDIHDTLFRMAGYLYTLDIFGVDDLLNEGPIVRRKVLQACNVYFVDDKQRGFASE